MSTTYNMSPGAVWMKNSDTINATLMTSSGLGVMEIPKQAKPALFSVDRLCSQARERLRVSIEANADYALKQFKAKWAPSAILVVDTMPWRALYAQQALGYARPPAQDAYNLGLFAVQNNLMNAAQMRGWP